MDKEREPWERTSAAAESTTVGIKRGLGEYINEISLVICLVFTVGISLVTVELQNPFSAEFFMNTVYMLLCTYTAYLVFIPSGKRDELARTGTDVQTRWHALCERVRGSGYLARFCEYCKGEASRECAERRRHMLESSGVSYDGYLISLSRMKRRELASEVRKGVLSKGAARAVRRAGKLRPKTIIPAIVLSECRDCGINDAGRRRMSYEQRSQMTRPIIMLISSMCFASAILVPTGTVGMGVVITVLSRLFQVCMASFAGYNVGVKEIRWERARTEGKILFIQRFFESTDAENKPEDKA